MQPPRTALVRFTGAPGGRGRPGRVPRGTASLKVLSLAVQWGVELEIERAIKKSARFC